MSGKKFIRILITSVVIVSVCLTVIFFIMQKAAADKPVIRTGQVEMRQYDIASKLPGRIEWIAVDEGDRINKGDVVFRLADSEIRAKEGQAKGGVESALALMNKANKGARPEEIEMAHRNFLAAESKFRLAEKTYGRMSMMYRDSLISSQEMDIHEQNFNGAKAMRDAAMAQYSMAQNGTRIEDKMMAAGQYSKAIYSLDEVRAYLDESEIRSFIGGIVAKRYADAGELVSTGYPVISVIDTADNWVELNLPETELAKLRIGMALKGSINGLGVIEQFKVASFSALSDYANWRTTADKATFDVRTFTVKLKPLRGVISSLRPGMTVNFNLGEIQAN